MTSKKNPYKNKCKIAMLPFLQGSNHYSALIVGILNKLGYDTVPTTPAPWSPLKIFDDPSVDLVFLYWLHPLYRGRTALHTAIKSLVFLWVSKKLKKKKFIYSVENYYPHDCSFKILDRFFVNLICRKASAILCTSQTSKERFVLHFPRLKNHNYYIIPHPSYGVIYENCRVDRTTARASLNIPDNATACLYLGLLRPYKGVPDLIHLYSKIASSNDYLIICGQPVNKSAAKKISNCIESLPSKIKEQIRFLDRFLEDEDLPKYFAAADFFATNYVVEPANPGSPILAMTFGLPIYAAHTGSLPEIVGAENMYGYDPSCYQSRQITLRRAFCDTEKTEKRDRLLKKIESRHSVENLAPLYKNLLGENI